MPGFSGIFYAYVLLNVTLYRKLKRKGERMPEFIWLIIGAVVGIALGFVVTRYLSTHPRSERRKRPNPW